jgi:hypothetical protein
MVFEERSMAENEEKLSDKVESKPVFAFADFSYITLLFTMSVFEYAFIKHVWLKPGPTIDLAMKIPLQILVLTPAIAGLKARVTMGRKLKAGEISPSYASYLSTWLVFQLCFVYLTFISLVVFLCR